MKLNFLFFLLLAQSIWGQDKPQNGLQASKADKVALTHVYVWVNPDLFIENATILIEDGKVLNVEKKGGVPNGFLEFDRSGTYVLPAFIELYSNLGVSDAQYSQSGESPQLESSKKGAYYWNESIHPEINAIEKYQTNTTKTQDFQKLGFGFVATHQMDGLVRGTGPLIALGASPEKSIFKSKVASYYSFSKGSSQQTYPSSLMGSIALIRQAFYDLDFYRHAKSKGAAKLSMEAWMTQGQMPMFFKLGDKWDVLRAAKIGQEFNIPFIYMGTGSEYGALREIQSLGAQLVLPINFPKPYNVSDPYVARNISLSELKHWELAPYNFQILQDAKIPIALSSHGCENTQFWTNLRKMVSLGTTPQSLLNALTLKPAQMIQCDSLLGSLDTGKWATFSVYNKNPFYAEAQILESWQYGEPTEWSLPQKINILGEYSLTLKSENYLIKVSGDPDKPVVKLTSASKIFDKKSKTYKSDTIATTPVFSRTGSDVTLQFSVSPATDKVYLMHGKILSEGRVWEGDITFPSGEWGQWAAIRKKTESIKDSVPSLVKVSLPSQWFPNMAYGFMERAQTIPIVYEQVTIWTNESDGIIERGYVVTQNGKITYVGKNKPAYPTGCQIINGEGKHLTSGIIDEHSHIAIARGVNEGGQSVSAEVSIADVVSPDDISIYRQLAGGVTAAQLLHGSANVIGGQSALIKLKWGENPEEMKITNAPKFIKCALGENVKQANWGDRSTVRFPQTRMGVEQVFYDGFYRALAYKKEWQDFKNCTNCPLSSKPRKDLELEVLNEILEGSRFITCHSYVQSEINMLMKVADSMHFKVNTFTHILEGYKVADKMAQHGVGGSTFGDWWAYKFEVNDAIPYNAALMHAQGVVVAINSDDAEMGRRLNQEAAKTIKYGGVSEEEAWKMVTLNPAKLLHLEDRMGSVKVGKDADLVLWSANPLSITAVVENTTIDGKVYYSKSQDEQLQKANVDERMRIIAKMLSKETPAAEKQPFMRKKKTFWHCDTMGEDASESENMH